MCLWLLFLLEAQTQNEALPAIYHSTSSRKIEVLSGGVSLGTCTHRLFNTQA